MTVEHPTGRVTLVFTDLEGSSELTERHGVAFEAVRNRHFSLLRKAAEDWQGFEVETAGDSLFVVFAHAANAVSFAVAAQQAIAQEPWPRELGSIRVRMGAHTGEPFVGLDNGRVTYRGSVTNRAARIQAAGHGGQILLSTATRDAAADGGTAPDITFIDRGVHRLKGVGCEQIWQVVHPELIREFPPLNTLPSDRHNLPLPPTPLIGRLEEIAAWRTLLQQPAIRLVTVFGFGGMGKTRAALHLAELCLDDFREGVWWIDLEGVDTAEAMISRIADDLPLQLRSQPAISEQLNVFLKERQILLVLDNTEQIDDAAVTINQLLSCAPRLKFLVTSRRALELRAEHVVQLHPLPPADAMMMFAERARARRPDFELGTVNQTDVGKLCQQLDGVPLAIELAASRARSMSPREIGERLGERLDFLQGRSSDLAPRQRALRAVIDWSHDLLADDERELFAQLAVFAGSFTLPQAEKICDVPDVAWSIEELLSQSLLRHETVGATQQTRFSMLAMLRDYATEKLEAQPAAALIRLRHAEYFLAFITERLKKLRTRDEDAAFAEVEEALENVRAALDWSRHSHQPEIAAKLALALGQFIHRRGFLRDAISNIDIGAELIQAVPGSDAATKLRAELLCARASLHLDLFEWQEAADRAGEAMALFENAADWNGAADCLNLQGLAAFHAKEMQRARDLFLQAKERYHRCANVSGEGIVLHNMGLVETYDGHSTEASRFLVEALALRRAGGDLRGVAETCNNLGVLAQEHNDNDGAELYYTEALNGENALQHAFGVARALSNLGEIAQLRRDDERAFRLFAAAERLFEMVGSPYQSYSGDLLQTVSATLDVSAQALQSIRAGLKDKTLAELVAWAHHTPAPDSPCVGNLTPRP